MQNKLSEYSFKIENRLQRFLAIFFLILIIICSILFVLKIQLWVVVGLALLALLATTVFVLMLHFRYRKLPLVQEKLVLLDAYRQASDQLRSTEQKITKADNRRKEIDLARTKDIEGQETAHQKRLIEFKKHREQIRNSADRELSSLLNQLQTKFISNGMHSAIIRDAQIKGVGPKLKQKLEQYGITSAADVAMGRIASISGFGEAKVNAIVDWRNTVECQLQAGKPTKVPKEQKDAIEARVEQQLASVAKGEEASENMRAGKIEDIKTWTEQEHAKNNAEEVEAKGRLPGEIGRQKAAENALTPYEGITFTRYLRQSLRSSQPIGKVPAPIATGLLLIILFGGPLSFIGLAAGSTKEIIIASIPTVTMTPTLTNTPTNTATYTSTATSTCTHTPTVTFTPTITFTPTTTFTPTITYTPTATGSPTVTLPATDGSSCVPKNTQHEVGYVTGVIDGNTIEVKIGNGKFKVRYIGIDTPDTATKQEYFGAEATYKNRTLVEGRMVTLVKEVSEANSSSYLLRYVFVGPVFVNYELVRLGFAKPVSLPVVSCSTTFTSAQRTAQTNSYGIWMPTPTMAPFIPTAPNYGGGDSGGGSSCCRVCTSGKACGDGCIAMNKTCHQPPGCACNG